MNDTTAAATHNFDIIARDGSAIRRGWIELLFDPYYGEELTTEQQAHPAFIFQVLQKQNGDDVLAEYKVFATKLPADLDVALKKTIIKRAMDKITDELLIPAFIQSFDTWETELERFAEYAREADVTWFS
jgi:hypothetical protein